MTIWSDEFADEVLKQSPPSASFERWRRAGLSRGLRGLRLVLSPRQNYCSGFEIGLRAGLAILDETRGFLLENSKHLVPVPDEEGEGCD